MISGFEAVLNLSGEVGRIEKRVSGSGKGLESHATSQLENELLNFFFFVKSFHADRI